MNKTLTANIYVFLYLIRKYGFSKMMLGRSSSIMMPSPINYHRMMGLDYEIVRKLYGKLHDDGIIRKTGGGSSWTFILGRPRKFTDKLLNKLSSKLGDPRTYSTAVGFSRLDREKQLAHVNKIYENYCANNMVNITQAMLLFHSAYIGSLSYYANSRIFKADNVPLTMAVSRRFKDHLASKIGLRRMKLDRLKDGCPIRFQRDIPVAHIILFESDSLISFYDSFNVISQSGRGKLKSVNEITPVLDIIPPILPELNAILLPLMPIRGGSRRETHRDRGSGQSSGGWKMIKTFEELAIIIEQHCEDVILCGGMAAWLLGHDKIL